MKQNVNVSTQPYGVHSLDGAKKSDRKRYMPTATTLILEKLRAKVAQHTEPEAAAHSGFRCYIWNCYLQILLVLSRFFFIAAPLGRPEGARWPLVPRGLLPPPPVPPLPRLARWAEAVAAAGFDLRVDSS